MIIFYEGIHILAIGSAIFRAFQRSIMSHTGLWEVNFEFKYNSKLLVTRGMHFRMDSRFHNVTV